MTEKRFTETVSTGIVTDNVTKKEYNCEMRIDDDLLDLINALDEENTHLKKQLNCITKSLQNELNNHRSFL